MKCSKILPFIVLLAFSVVLGFFANTALDYNLVGVLIGLSYVTSTIIAIISVFVILVILYFIFRKILRKTGWVFLAIIFCCILGIYLSINAGDVLQNNESYKTLRCVFPFKQRYKNMYGSSCPEKISKQVYSYCKSYAAGIIAANKKCHISKYSTAGCGIMLLPESNRFDQLFIKESGLPKYEVRKNNDYQYL